MIYIIKFLYSWLLPPGLFILLFLPAVIWLWRRQRRIATVLLALTTLLYLTSTGLFSEALVRGLERQYEQPAAVHGDVLVVLGAGATQGTPDIDGKGNLLGSAANRLLTAVRLHRATGLPILFSGGQVFPDSGNEADIAHRQLLALGVPEQDILIENTSLNTEQNAENTAVILQQNHLQQPVLITSGFHLPRAVLQFEKAGIHVQPIPTDYMASSSVQFYWGKIAPSSAAMSLTGLALKEYLGILAARLH
ncbi:YdcF family protein [Paenibacillus sp. JX-17]|uniref:YdcF family protein n=1 Tax=Paenibacillus lacisoli TaxID=3064525 RepID=A0ABT9CEL1_9BACL|nr:YdcF family protein [Paenibacillus sp. JX-17]MDO7907715.1 YdcF family protein [Paenibacillus sp. JX-17]